MSAARVPVFLLDETPGRAPGRARAPSGDIPGPRAGAGISGSSARLPRPRTFAAVAVFSRWTGLTGYFAWSPGGPSPMVWAILRSTSRSPRAPTSWRICSSQRVEAGYGARIAAGFCWPWSDPRADGSLVPDVVIGNSAKPWNLRGERALGGAPPAALWAGTDPSRVRPGGLRLYRPGIRVRRSGVMSSGPTSCGGVIAGSLFAAPTRTLTSRSLVRPPTSSLTGWFAMSTRCC